MAYLVMINSMNSDMSKSMRFLILRDSEVMSVTYVRHTPKAIYAYAMR